MQLIMNRILYTACEHSYNLDLDELFSIYFLSWFIEMELFCVLNIIYKVVRIQ
jgi:hypothetical protein